MQPAQSSEPSPGTGKGEKPGNHVKGEEYKNGTDETSTRVVGRGLSLRAAEGFRKASCRAS